MWNHMLFLDIMRTWMNIETYDISFDTLELFIFRYIIKLLFYCFGTI